MATHPSDTVDYEEKWPMNRIPSASVGQPSPL